ncbi:uncharacterized protein LOC143125242 [Alosa pseudoharengus]|uniref:uncharacterized protein LOC143125242 n=1 Tax=Alosa pseudoharengus TaxID=34774 RepID=UPI003F8CBCCD
MTKIQMLAGTNPAHNEQVCSTWGNYHFKTFDGDIFQLPSSCNYVLTSQCKSSYEDFNIQMRRELENGLPIISKITMVLEGTVVELVKGSVSVNGKLVILPFSESGVLIEKSPSYINIKAKLGLLAKWNENDAFMVELDKKYVNQTCGLCGDFNGVQNYNEFVTNEGVPISNLDYGSLWKLDGPTETCTEPVTSEPTCKDMTSVCEQLLSSPAFESCKAVVNADSFIKTCARDLCLCANSSDSFCLCGTISEYSRQCIHAGGKPGEWRTEQFCSKSCPSNMVHQECGSPCVDTCSNPDRGQVCEEHCMDGCFCPPGTVFDDVTGKGCISSTKCSCSNNGNIYQPGESYSSNCKHCTCGGGQWSCIEKDCPATCSVEGGSHFFTYDGKAYTFHGDCTYVLTKQCNGADFTVLGDLVRCGLTDTETCLKAVMLAVSGDTVINIQSNGKVFVNRKYSQLPLSTAGVKIFEASTFFIIVQTSVGIQLEIQLSPIMQVYITADSKLKQKTCGLCGNFNSIQADDFLAMNGIIEGTASGFANTWKTRASCPDVKSSLENPCSLSVDNEKYAQQWCSLLTDPDGVFSPCHSEINPDIYKENCMYDSCNCEKSEDCMCAALSSYVHACAAKGIQLNGWRDTTCKKYATNCPSNMVYAYSIQNSDRSCRCYSDPDFTCSATFAPVDGCICEKETYLDEGGECVAPTNCSCYYKGQVIPPGEVISKDQATCTCKAGKLSCMGASLNLSTACPSPMVYFNCSNANAGAKGAECQRSCKTLHMACISAECVSGCVCPSGLVSDGKGGCVKEDQCPCYHNGAQYKAGDSIKVDCNKCTCKDTKWDCTSNLCHGTCAIYGDGHYITFDGKRFNFDGSCEYILTENYCGHGSTNGTFRVITENIPCGTTGTTCSKAIKLFLGSNELILTDGGYQVVKRNSGAEVPYQIRTMGIYLVIEANNGLILMWDRRTSLFLKLSPEFKGNVCGLCGNYDGNANNDFGTRNQGQAIQSLEFGNSWKVSPSCPDAKQTPSPCTSNPYRKSWAQKKCSIIISEAFASCHFQVDPSPFYDACVSDSCACDSGGDCECFCTAVAAYAAACNEAGACVAWRTPKICPLFCDYYNPPGECEWHYKPCGAPCMKTCRNPTGQCSQQIPALEGCYPQCPVNEPFFDEDTMKCVQREKCGCFDSDGRHYSNGEKVPTTTNCETWYIRQNGAMSNSNANTENNIHHDHNNKSINNKSINNNSINHSYIQYNTMYLTLLRTMHIHYHYNTHKYINSLYTYNSNIDNNLHDNYNHSKNLDTCNNDTVNFNNYISPNNKSFIQHNALYLTLLRTMHIHYHYNTHKYINSLYTYNSNIDNNLHDNYNHSKNLDTCNNDTVNFNNYISPNNKSFIQHNALYLTLLRTMHIHYHYNTHKYINSLYTYNFDNNLHDYNNHSKNLDTCNNDTVNFNNYISPNNKSFIQHNALYLTLLRTMHIHYHYNTHKYINSLYTYNSNIDNNLHDNYNHSKNLDTCNNDTVNFNNYISPNNKSFIQHNALYLTLLWTMHIHYHYNTHKYINSLYTYNFDNNLHDYYNHSKNLDTCNNDTVNFNNYISPNNKSFIQHNALYLTLLWTMHIHYHYNTHKYINSLYTYNFDNNLHDYNNHSKNLDTCNNDTVNFNNYISPNNKSFIQHNALYLTLLRTMHIHYHYNTHKYINSLYTYNSNIDNNLHDNYNHSKNLDTCNNDTVNFNNYISPNNKSFIQHNALYLTLLWTMHIHYHHNTHKYINSLYTYNFDNNLHDNYNHSKNLDTCNNDTVNFNNYISPNNKSFIQHNALYLTLLWTMHIHYHYNTHKYINSLYTYNFDNNLHDYYNHSKNLDTCNNDTVNFNNYISPNNKSFIQHNALYLTLLWTMHIHYHHNTHKYINSLYTYNFDNNLHDYYNHSKNLDTCNNDTVNFNNYISPNKSFIQHNALYLTLLWTMHIHYHHNTHKYINSLYTYNFDNNLHDNYNHSKNLDTCNNDTVNFNNYISPNNKSFIQHNALYLTLLWTMHIHYHHNTHKYINSLYTYNFDNNLHDNYNHSKNLDTCNNDTVNFNNYISPNNKSFIQHNALYLTLLWTMHIHYHYNTHKYINSLYTYNFDNNLHDYYNHSKNLDTCNNDTVNFNNYISPNNKSFIQHNALYLTLLWTMHIHYHHNTHKYINSLYTYNFDNNLHDYYNHSKNLDTCNNDTVNFNNYISPNKSFIQHNALYLTLLWTMHIHYHHNTHKYINSLYTYNFDNNLHDNYNHSKNLDTCNNDTVNFNNYISPNNKSFIQHNALYLTLLWTMHIHYHHNTHKYINSLYTYNFDNNLHDNYNHSKNLDTCNNDTVNFNNYISPNNKSFIQHNALYLTLLWTMHIHYHHNTHKYINSLYTYNFDNNLHDNYNHSKNLDTCNNDTVNFNNYISPINKSFIQHNALYLTLLWTMHIHYHYNTHKYINSLYTYNFDNNLHDYYNHSKNLDTCNNDTVNFNNYISPNKSFIQHNALYLTLLWTMHIHYHYNTHKYINSLYTYNFDNNLHDNYNHSKNLDTCNNNTVNFNNYISPNNKSFIQHNALYLTLLWTMHIHYHYNTHKYINSLYTYNFDNNLHDYYNHSKNLDTCNNDTVNFNNYISPNNKSFIQHNALYLTLLWTMHIHYHYNTHKYINSLYTYNFDNNLHDYYNHSKNLDTCNNDTVNFNNYISPNKSFIQHNALYLTLLWTMHIHYHYNTHKYINSLYTYNFDNNLHDNYNHSKNLDTCNNDTVNFNNYISPNNKSFIQHNALYLTLLWTMHIHYHYNTHKYINSLYTYNFDNNLHDYYNHSKNLDTCNNDTVNFNNYISPNNKSFIQHNALYLKNGETWVSATDKCMLETCYNGDIIKHLKKCPTQPPLSCVNGLPPKTVPDGSGCCFKQECQCHCFGFGDPHYVTFDGTYYGFQGNCSYILVKEIKPIYNFSIIIDNVYCDAPDGLSCPKSLTIHYKSFEIFMSQEVSHGIVTNLIYVNHKRIYPAYSNRDFQVTDNGIEALVVIPAIGAQIMFSGMQFSVELPWSKFHGNTEGQCGTCDNNRTDDCLLPNGKIDPSCPDMAHQWKVNDSNCPVPPTTIPPSTCPPETLSICKIIASNDKLENDGVFHRIECEPITCDTYCPQVNGIWSPPGNKCVKYECVKVGSRFITMEARTLCPPYNPNDCIPVLSGYKHVSALMFLLPGDYHQQKRGGDGLP